jgi:hypothetical protein
MKPRAQIVHALPGRLRFKVPEMRGQADFFDRIRVFLQGQEEVEGIAVNPLTGSVLITASDSADLREVADRGETIGLYTLADGPVQVASASERARLDLARLDARWTRASGGSSDLRSTLVALLVVGGLVQLARGEILGTASQLLVTAYQLLDVAPGSEEH